MARFTVDFDIPYAVIADQRNTDRVEQQIVEAWKHWVAERRCAVEGHLPPSERLAIVLAASESELLSYCERCGHAAYVAVS